MDRHLCLYLRTAGMAAASILITNCYKLVTTYLRYIWFPALSRPASCGFLQLISSRFVMFLGSRGTSGSSSVSCSHAGTRFGGGSFFFNRPFVQAIAILPGLQ